MVLLGSEFQCLGKFTDVAYVFMVMSVAYYVKVRIKMTFLMYLHQ